MERKTSETKKPDIRERHRLFKNKQEQNKLNLALSDIKSALIENMKENNKEDIEFLLRRL